MTSLQGKNCGFRERAGDFQTGFFRILRLHQPGDFSDPAIDWESKRNSKRQLGSTWSSLLVCRSRCLRKSKREHLRTRMRSVVPSARWAAGERPLGLRGQAQLMLAALMARNFPLIVLHSLLLSTKEKHTHTHTPGSSSHVFCHCPLLAERSAAVTGG